MHDMPNLQESSLNVTFYLLTGSDQTGSTVLTTGDIRSLRDSSFNSSNPTRIIVHGFCNCHLSQFCEATRQKLVKQPQQYNVITMSWPSGKWLLDYWTARWRIDPASQILADFIDFLHTAGGMDLQDLYLVGHSLGAHLSGLAGKKVTSGKVGTIVALDPAKPAFDINKPDERLAITDANYVEVIHTNGKRLGMYEPIGHTDFYPNGGVQQPGCSMWWFGASCAHGRAWELYAESIESKLGFWSTLCSSLDMVSEAGCRSPKAKLKMGGDPIVQTERGILTVRTKATSPYAEGKLQRDDGKRVWRSRFANGSPPVVYGIIEQ
ncbi:hypothetical protein RP20_CCG004727 [Aedes albopictus]|nr:hypothetical protein RP20_CCG004727 [Aedes albopictus]